MTIQQRVFARFYRRASTPESVLWHRDEPPELLTRAAAQRTPGDRALDLGCGTGVYAVHLAQQGLSVVGVDFVAAALQAARARAGEAGVMLELVESDIFDYEPDASFDLILDSGCLHHVPASKVGEYRARIERWLRPGGDYVLVHFTKRSALAWRPGGRRVKREDMVGAFPWLRLEAYDETSFSLPFPMGDTPAGVYWFRRGAAGPS